MQCVHSAGVPGFGHSEWEGRQQAEEPENYFAHLTLPCDNTTYNDVADDHVDDVEQGTRHHFAHPLPEVEFVHPVSPDGSVRFLPVV